MSTSSLNDGVAVFDFIELLHASNWVSSPVYAGWLHKRNKNWLMTISGYAWQPKWVALHGLELIYMDDEPTNDNKTSIHIKRMAIGSTTRIIAEDEEHNDILCFSIQPDCTKPRMWQFRAESEEEKTNWLIKISQVHAIAAWLDSYTKEKVLGVGAQGTVYEMVHKNTGQRHAVKEVNIENEKQMKMAITEAKLLMSVTKNVTHPCIMQIEKVFQVVDKFYLVFPLCTGGELYEAVVRRGHFTERKASRIVHDLVSALHALHEHNILHLDIKPENILFESDQPNARIKLTDFGLSKVFTNTPEALHTRPTQAELAARAESFINCGNFNADHVRGTFGYMSPELILTGYCSTASDVFAAGVILYILLCGYPPFNSKSVRQLFVRTVKGAYKLSGPEWDGISAEAKDLVKKMLDVNMETRITTAEVLAHPWIAKVAEADQLHKESLSRSHAASIDETLLQSSAAVVVGEGLHGKSSVVYGAVLHQPSGDSVQSTSTTGAITNPNTEANASMFGNSSPNTPTTPTNIKRFTNTNTNVYDEYYDQPIANSDVSLKMALNHLAGHVKELKTEKLAKTMNRLMLAKQKSGESKLATIYLKPYYSSSGMSSGGSGGSSGGSGDVSGSSSGDSSSGNSSSGNVSSNVSASPNRVTSVYRNTSASTMAPIAEENTEIDSLHISNPVDTTTTTDTTANNTNTANNTIARNALPTLTSAFSTSFYDTDLISSTNTSGKDSFTFDALDIEKVDIHSPISPMSNITSIVSVPTTTSIKVPITPSGNKDDELLQMVNSEAREIVTRAIFDYFGAVEGCLTVAQFVRLLMKLGLLGKCGSGSSGIVCGDTSGSSVSIGVQNVCSTNTGTNTTNTTNTSANTTPLEISLYGVLIAQFTDSNHKGYITMNDFYTVQVLILQRNELYLRTIFKLYQHSVHYPGRDVNFDNAYKSLQNTTTDNIANIPSTAGTNVNTTSTVSLNNTTLDVEPPRYITARHVACVFERFGFDPRSGTKVFNILHDVLAKLKRERRMSSVAGSVADSPLRPVTHTNTTNNTHTQAHSTSTTPNAPAPNGTTNTSTTNNETHTMSATNMIAESVMSAFSYFAAPIKAINTSLLHNDTTSNNAIKDTDNISNDEKNNNTNHTTTNNTNNSADPYITTTPPLSPHLIHSIDVSEFLHLSQMDEILVDVISREAHQKLFTLFLRVETQYLLCRERMGEVVNTEVLKKVVDEEVKVVLDDPTF